MDKIVDTIELKYESEGFERLAVFIIYLTCEIMDINSIYFINLRFKTIYIFVRKNFKMIF
jgi:hypothetical protein